MRGRPIPGYEGIYSATRDGRIWKHPRRWVTGRHAMRRFSRGAYVPLLKAAHGYLKVNIYKDGNRCQKLVHRLVALTFVKNQLSLPQVNHRNGVKTDNRASNLEWVTAAQNKRHAVDTGLCRFDSPKFLAAVRKNVRAAHKARGII